jgi:hypothetical protein
LIQSAQTPEARTPALLSRRGAPLGESQPDLPRTSRAAAIQDSSPLFASTFGLIDFPRSTSTTATGINDKGEIVGGYNDVNLMYYVMGDNAFRLKKDSFSSIDFPGAVQTLAYGINKSGEIIGLFVDSSGVYHGFTLVGSTYTQFDCPGAYTVPYAINESGAIVGYCGGTNTGFLLSGGVYTAIVVPGASGGTWAEGINNAGVIVGWYETTPGGDGPTQGFIYDGGSFTTINYPGSPYTYLAGINDSGLIVGGYGTPLTVGSTTYDWPNGFTYSAGTFSTIDAPFGAVEVTNPLAVNNKGEIVGGYVDSAGMTYGFYLKVTQ